MKTTFKLLKGLIILLILGACEKDEIDPSDPYVNGTADVKAVNNFNNGMINSYSSETLLKWNELLSQSIDFKFPQPTEAKIYAMVTLAMHDALNNVVPKYETYALDNLEVNPSGITKKNIHSIADAAVSQAARDMIAQQFPPATPAADALLAAVLSQIEASDLKDRGISIGREAALALQQKRSGDFPLIFTSYAGSEEPGQYRSDFFPWRDASSNPPFNPANAVFAQNLGSLTPFGIESGDQFRDEAPYPLNSEEYLKDYNEVKAVGCAECPERTEEQSLLGAFWIENNSSSMNRLSRALIAQRKLDGWEAARLVALVQMSIIDAYIASFEGKWYYKFWRPVTAIRQGDFDGNDATIGDANWSTGFPTPPTPEFPSTHAYSGGAATSVFKAFFKSDHLDLMLTNPYTLPGIERHISSFSQISRENALSRIYIGYHFRRAIEVGERQGHELGEYVFENNLRELKKIL